MATCQDMLEEERSYYNKIIEKYIEEKRQTLISKTLNHKNIGKA
jgi:hypothetical protein